MMITVTNSSNKTILNSNMKKMLIKYIKLKKKINSPFVRSWLDIDLEMYSWYY